MARHDLRLLVIFLVITAGLGFLVHQVSYQNWRRCEVARSNTIKINRTNDAFQQFLGSFVAKSPKPDDLRRFIRIYQDATLPIPDCGPRPLF